MFKKWFKKPNDDKHSIKPQKDAPPPDIEEMLKSKIQEMTAAPYRQYLAPLHDKVVGKTVMDTLAGTSGFVLSFSDSSWAMVYLENMELHWQVGQGNSYKAAASLINSSEYGNGYNPIPIDKMYADKICDIKSEISNAVGKDLAGLSIGSNCFNFCFPDKRELDTSIVPTSEGKPALRVFWEQW